MSVAYTIPALDQTIWLAPRPFATGGEGALYHITAPIAYQGYVVKLLHPNKRSAERATKASHLVAHPPPAPSSAQVTIIWVKQLVYDVSGAFAGLLLPEAVGCQLELLTTAHLPRRHAAEWAGWSRDQPQAERQRLALGYALAAAVHTLHKSGCYSLSDLKPDNILVTPDGQLALVDTDSVAVWEGETLLFKASVATPEYTPPEANHKHATPSMAWDRFSLAVILYRLLLGVHPFAASACAPYDQQVALDHKIQAGLFVQAPVVSVEWQTVPPLHQGFTHLHPALQVLFVRAFQEGHHCPDARPSAQEWAQALVQSHSATLHFLPSSRFKRLFDTPTAGYQMIQQVVQTYPHPIPSHVFWYELPSAELIKRTRQYYKKAGQMIWKGIEATIAIGGLVVVLVSVGILIMGWGKSGWDTGWNLLVAMWMVVVENFQPLWIPFLVLSPLIWAVIEEWRDAWLALRQKRWLNNVRWNQLSEYTLKHLQRWKTKLFRERSKLRHQLRALKKEQALYTNVKQARERQVQTAYQPQLQQLYAELHDYQTAWEVVLDQYDQQTHALLQAEYCELQAAASSTNQTTTSPFPALLPVVTEDQTIRNHYTQQRTAILAEAQQAYKAHQTALMTHLETWSQQQGFAQQLLDQDYCTVLNALQQLDQQVNQQKLALGEIDERLKVVREALR